MWCIIAVSCSRHLATTKTDHFLALKTDYLINIRNRAIHNANNSWYRCLYHLQHPEYKINVVDRCCLVQLASTTKTDHFLALKTDYLINIRNREIHNANNSWYRCLYTPTTLGIQNKCGASLLSRAVGIYYIKTHHFWALKTDYLIKILNRAIHNGNNSWYRCLYHLQHFGIQNKCGASLLSRAVGIYY